jgi:hypothetical protein
MGHWPTYPLLRAIGRPVLYPLSSILSSQLEEIARGVATQGGELPAGDELARVVDAAKGLTRSEAENAYSLSLVRHGTLKPETLKSRAVRRLQAEF